MRNAHWGAEGMGGRQGQNMLGLFMRHFGEGCGEWEQSGSKWPCEALLQRNC